MTLGQAGVTGLGKGRKEEEKKHMLMLCFLAFHHFPPQISC